ncbi:MAG: DUF5947 family protein [Acidobacteriaceae bacterium]
MSQKRDMGHPAGNGNGKDNSKGTTASATTTARAEATMSEAPEISEGREGTPSFLRQYARRRSAAERCELCSAELGPAHQHLLDAKKREVMCCCDGCAVLFCGQPGAHFLRIPRRIRSLAGFRMEELQWESLMIPINLAFFYRDRAAGKVVAMYPSPAGAIASLLSLEAWAEIASEHSELQAMEPDVETFLVNRVGAEPEYYIAPIDECYRLVGLIRMHWRGLSGGGEVWTGINQFFADLRSRSVEAREPARA